MSQHNKSPFILPLYHKLTFSLTFSCTAGSVLIMLSKIKPLIAFTKRFLKRFCMFIYFHELTVILMELLQNINKDIVKNKFVILHIAFCCRNLLYYMTSFYLWNVFKTLPSFPCWCCSVNIIHYTFLTTFKGFVRYRRKNIQNAQRI
jgi:hypothetical protein